MAAGELAGERITVALLTRDPENEHSCFSDTTSADLAADAAGLEALCSGVFQSGQTIGVGLCSLGEPELARRVKAALELTRTLPRPFDKALALPDESAERVRMFAVRDAWQAIGRDAAQLLDGIEAAP
jgi:putative iron-regulated protein